MRSAQFVSFSSVRRSTVSDIGDMPGVVRAGGAVDCASRTALCVRRATRRNSPSQRIDRLLLSVPARRLLAWRAGGLDEPPVIQAHGAYIFGRLAIVRDPYAGAPHLFFSGVVGRKRERQISAEHA